MSKGIGSEWLQVNPMDPNGMVVDPSGTARQAEAGFHTSLHNISVRTSCDSSNAVRRPARCVFHDVTAGDIDVVYRAVITASPRQAPTVFRLLRHDRAD